MEHQLAGCGRLKQGGLLGGVTKNTLRYQRQVARQTAYREESAESIVPDTLPDIARIVDATGTAYLRDWELGSDEVTVKCAVRTSVLYMAEEDKKLYRIETPISFSQRIELRGAEPGCDVLYLHAGLRGRAPSTRARCPCA